MSLIAVRRYSAALFLAGVLVGAAPAAAADPVPEAAPSVNFSGGGLGVLLCGSRPNVPKISIVAETKVRLVNGLGQKAELRIDGQAKSSIADGSSIEVQFHRGPVSVALVPSCLLNLNPTFEPLTVEVTRKPGQSTQPSRPGRPKTSPSTAPAQPGARPPSTTPPLEGEIPVPPPDAPLFPEDGVTPSGDMQQSPVTIPSETNLGMVPTSGNSDKGPIGLLAIIATVCVVGVLSGAIRAIITQRATRTEFA